MSKYIAANTDYTPPAGVSQLTTLTGIPVLHIPAALNRDYPDEAYKPIPHGIGKQKGYTDLDHVAVTDRLMEVFGPQGIGWRLGATNVTHLDIYSEEREALDRDKNPYSQTWFVADIVNVTFYYSIIGSDGNVREVMGSTLSDSSDNMDRSYAIRGAYTALLKQIVSRMGGMRHIQMEERTHQTVRSQPKGKPSGNGNVKPPDERGPLSDDFTDANVVNDFFGYWKEQGCKPAEVLKILDVASIKDWTVGRAAADEVIRQAVSKTTGES